MATGQKPVIKIDVEDGAFKRFAAEFAAFMSSLDQVKQSSKEATKAAKKQADAEAEALTARKKAEKTKTDDDRAASRRADEKAKQAKKEADTAKRAATDRKKEREDDIRQTKELAKWTADVAKSAAGAAAGFAKWLAFGAIASGFGLGGLASSAAGARRQAQGIGVNTGELRAAGVNFGKYIDPEAALSNIANAQSDVNKRWIFNAIGQRTEGKSSGDILAEALPKLVQAFRAGGSTLQGADARGLTQLVGIEDLRRLSSLTQRELSDTIDAYRRDRETLAVGDSTNRDWQEFLVSLHRSGQEIENSLIRGLVTLTPYLSKFSDGIAKAIDAFATNGGLQEWIEKLGAGLQKLGAYLGSKEFGEDVDAFFRGVHAMAKALGRFFPDTELKQQADQPAPKENASKFQATKDVYGAIWDHLVGNDKLPLSVRNHNPGNLRVPGSTTEFQKFSSDTEGLRALVGQIGLYESRDKLTTLRGIISKYSPGTENDTQALIANAAKRTGFGPDQQLDPASIDQLVKVVLAITKQENGASNFTDKDVRLLIQNTTGGNASVSVAGLAAGG